MVCTSCILLASVIAGAIWLLFKFLKPCGKAKPLHLDPEEWWGPKDLKEKDETIKPFEVKFSDDMIKDLKARINNHRPFVPPLEGVGFEYGFNSSQLDSWLKYWAEEYPFKKREAIFNKYPQYKTKIQGLDIHFIRVKPEVTDVKVIPLLLMHGWPGSVREFFEVIPRLTEKAPGYDFVFELVIPSLPGYGFSDAAVRPGLGAPKVAVIFKNLMTRLGFKQFYIQGGDWGSVIASAMATLYPDDILGHHSNLATTRNTCSNIWTAIGAYFPSLVVESHLASRLYPLSAFFAHLMEEFGYFHLQATKPDTVGVGLSDSPAGLLAYILEKFSTWTRNDYRYLVDGGLHSRFSKDQLIDNLMVYWSTNSIVTSMRLYAETMSSATRKLDIDSITTPVPTWALQAKHEIFYQPPKLLKTKYNNLLGNTVLEEGGHFLAFEMPEVFAKDVFKAVKAFRNWHIANGRRDV